MQLQNGSRYLCHVTTENTSGEFHVDQDTHKKNPWEEHLKTVWQCHLPPKNLVFSWWNHSQQPPQATVQTVFAYQSSLGRTTRLIKPHFSTRGPMTRHTEILLFWQRPMCISSGNGCYEYVGAALQPRLVVKWNPTFPVWCHWALTTLIMILFCASYLQPKKIGKVFSKLFTSVILASKDFIFLSGRDSS